MSCRPLPLWQPQDQLGLELMRMPWGADHKIFLRARGCAHSYQPSHCQHQSPAWPPDLPFPHPIAAAACGTDNISIKRSTRALVLLRLRLVGMNTTVDIAVIAGRLFRAHVEKVLLGLGRGHKRAGAHDNWQRTELRMLLIPPCSWSKLKGSAALWQPCILELLTDA